MATELKITVSSVATSMGYWMHPLARKDGALIWPVFNQSPWSNVLIACSPSMRTQAEDLVSSFEFNPDVVVKHIDQSMSPLECRILITRLLANKPPAYTRNAYTGNANMEHHTSQSARHIVLIVHGLDSMLDGVRRDSTREQVLERFSSLLKTGPSNGVHVILIQGMDDETAKTTSMLADLWGTVAVVGELTQVASAMLFPSSPLKQWIHEQTVKPTSRGHHKSNNGSRRRIAAIQTSSMTGVIDIPRKIGAIS